MKFILDASTAVVYSSPDDLAALTKLGSIVVPVTWRVEIASALHQAILAKDLTPAEAGAIARRLQALKVETADVAPPTTLLELQHKHAIAAYDAVYVAVAIARKLKIATLDGRLIRNLKARNMGHLLLPSSALPPPA